MSFGESVLLVCLMAMRLIPAIITLIIFYDTQYTKENKTIEKLILPLLALASIGIHFVVYLKVHNWILRGARICDTISSVIAISFPYQYFTYFSKSFLVCVLFALGFGLALRAIIQQFVHTKGGKSSLSAYRKAMVLLLTLVMGIAVGVCHCLKNLELKGIKINEICSNNESTFLDGVEGPCDYVELYNSGRLPYLIADLYLSDDASNLKKYEIPLNILMPQEYLLIGLEENAPFHISSSGETLYLSNGEGVMLDQVTCVALSEDTSYSRLTDGGVELAIRTCTPGISNEWSKPILSAPVFSHESGFYTEEFELILSAEEGSTIYYTLDGTIPNEESNRYEDGIPIYDASGNENVWSMREDVFQVLLADWISDLEEIGYKTPDHLIDKCTIVRALCVDDTGSKSQVISKSYFVNFDQKEGYQRMNVVSVITEPENLFDYHSGIYIAGETYDEFLAAQESGSEWPYWKAKANYLWRGEEWEREVSLHFFDIEGNLCLTKDAGMRIQGGESRKLIPRGLNFYARKDYDGRDQFETCFFGDQYEPQRVTLTAGGNDNLLKVRDHLMVTLASNRDFAIMDFEPYVMFLNGEYWGCYWLTEKYDEEYFMYHYNVAPDNIIMIKSSKRETIAIGEGGDDAVCDAMRSFIIETDLSLEENYQKACQLIDVDSFIDYYAAQIYICNTDWGYANNYGLWRTREIEDNTYSDGKWRAVLYDVNVLDCMSSKEGKRNLFEELLEGDPFFSSLMKNPEFEAKFVETILDMANTEFLPENVNDYLEGFRELMRTPLKKEYERFYGKGNDKLEAFDEGVNDIQLFFEERYEFITDYFESYPSKGKVVDRIG